MALARFVKLNKKTSFTLCISVQCLVISGNKIHGGSIGFLQQSTNFVDIMGFILTEMRDPTLFACMMWLLWNHRNNLRLGKPVVLLSQLLGLAKDKMQELSQ